MKLFVGAWVGDAPREEKRILTSEKRFGGGQTPYPKGYRFSPFFLSFGENNTKEDGGRPSPPKERA